MAGVRTFEDLKAWQQARTLSCLVRRAAGKPVFRRDSALASQLRRAASSVMSNVAEGFERGTLRELNQFLGYAKGSCGEVRSQLYEALDAGLLQPPEFHELQRCAISTSRLIAGLRRVTQARLKAADVRQPQ